MEQFLRTRLILGEDKFKKIGEAKVTVLGLGAVGSYVTEALSRAGVGTLRLVDFDTVKLTNLNRQLYALHSTLGKTKAEIAKARVLDINPHCRVETMETFISLETIERIMDNKPDLVIDAIDSLNPKIHALQYCHEHRIPVISSMGAALRMDPFSIKAGDLFDSYGCPLAYRIRKNLRHRGITEGIFCIFSSEAPRSTGIKGVDPDTLAEGNEITRGRKRNVLGSMPTITGMFGLTIAHHALRYLSGEITLTDHKKKKGKRLPSEPN